MAYTKTTWTNNSKTTVIDATNMNKIEDALYTLSSDSGWIALNDQVLYRKIGSVVYVIGTSDNGVSVGNDTYTVVGTLPIGYRPDYQMYFSWTGIGGAVTQQSAYVTPGGAIGLYLPAGQSTGYWGFTISFPV